MFETDGIINFDIYCELAANDDLYVISSLICPENKANWH